MSLLNCTFFSYPLGRGKVGEKTMSVSRIFYLYTNFLKKGVCVCMCLCVSHACLISCGEDPRKGCTNGTELQGAVHYGSYRDTSL